MGGGTQKYLVAPHFQDIDIRIAQNGYWWKVTYNILSVIRHYTAVTVCGYEL